MKPESNSSARLGILAVLLAAIALLAIPAAASAQDPAGDQYAPATPNGGGDYDFGPSGTPAPASGTGGDSSGGDAGSTGTDPVPAPTTPTDPAGTDPAQGGGNDGNRDQRTVDAIGAEGQQARDDDPAFSNAADKQLSSSDASTSAGLGTVLWVLIAAALMWAIVIGVLNFRSRGDTQGPAGSSRRGDDSHQHA